MPTPTRILGRYSLLLLLRLCRPHPPVLSGPRLQHPLLLLLVAGSWAPPSNQVKGERTRDRTNHSSILESPVESIFFSSSSLFSPSALCYQTVRYYFLSVLCQVARIRHHHHPPATTRSHRLPQTVEAHQSDGIAKPNKSYSAGNQSPLFNSFSFLLFFAIICIDPTGQPLTTNRHHVFFHG